MADDFPTDEPSDESSTKAGDDDQTHGTGDAQYDDVNRKKADQSDRVRDPEGAQ